MVPSLPNRVLNVVSSWITCIASLISGLQLAVYSATKLGKCAEQWKKSACQRLLLTNKRLTSLVSSSHVGRSVKILGVSTYRWTPQGPKLGVSGHRGHQWIDAYAEGTDLLANLAFED